MTIRHERRPISGANVEILGPSGQFAGVIRTATTDAKGHARFENLPPGDYHLSATHLGVSAAYHCFHVAAGSSFFARRKQTYDWGHWATAVRAVTGALVDQRPRSGGTLLWNITNRVTKPITNSVLRLHSFETAEVRTVNSDVSGNFDFGPLAPGKYVLHVVARQSEPAYPESHLLLNLHTKAAAGHVTLTHTPFSAGRCDDSLQASWK